MNSLYDWLLAERAKLSRHNKVAKAINYLFEKEGRWQAFTAFLDIDPQAWLTDILARLPDMPVSRVHELLPWNWKTRNEDLKAA